MIQGLLDDDAAAGLDTPPVVVDLDRATAGRCARPEQLTDRAGTPR